MNTADRSKIACVFRSKSSTPCAPPFPPTNPSACVCRHRIGDGGWDLEQTIVFVKELQRHKVDWIDVSSGGVSPLQKIPLSPGYQLPFAKPSRKRRA